MYKLMTLVVASVVLTGCLGSKRGPDEMTVVDSAPLTLPLSFELRPPRQGQAPAVINSNKKAKTLILGVENIKSTAPETTESWLIEKAGGSNRNQSIREIMAAEEHDARQNKKEEGWLEGMLSDDVNTDPTLEELAEIAKKEEAEE